MLELIALALTLPPSAAWVTVVYLQRTATTAERLAVIEKTLMATVDDVAAHKTAIAEAQQYLSRLADQRMGV